MANILTRYIEDRTLTAKEIEVIQMMADGFSNKEIAQKAGYKSDSSIETIRTRLLQKLSVKNGCECVAYALRNKLIV